MAPRAVALLACVATTGASLLRSRDPEIKTWDSTTEACKACLTGNMKEHFPWCSCFARKTSDGKATAQCQRPKMVGTFYDCVCKANVPNLQTGKPTPFMCSPLDPNAPTLAEGVQVENAAR